MAERWVKKGDEISGGAVSAGFAVLFLAGSIAMTAGRSVGPVGLVPLAAIATLAVLVPLLGRESLLEGSATLTSGLMAFASLMFGLQLSSLPDLRRRADVAEPGEASEQAAAALDMANTVGMVFMMTAFTAWLATWIAARQLARLRRLTEHAYLLESKEADERAWAEVRSALEAMQRELEMLRAERAPARWRSWLRGW